MDVPAPDAGDIERLAGELGCKAEEPLVVKPKRQTWRISREGTDLVFKCWAAPRGKPPYAVLAHRLLPEIEGDFSRLVLPRYLYDGYDAEVGFYLVMTFVHGRGYTRRWHYTRPGRAGGEALTPADIDLALDLLEDLKRVRMRPLLEAGLRVTTRDAAAGQFRKQLTALVAGGTLSDKIAEATGPVIGQWAEANPAEQLTLSNLDFRHLNFIVCGPRSAAVVDWDDAQASDFETESCVAYQWLFLWARPDLQARLIAGARDRFALDCAAFRAAMLLRAVAQIYTCRAAPDRVALHVSQLERTAGERQFEAIWEGGG